MDTPVSRPPLSDRLRRRAPAIAGFVLGALGLILGGMLVTVVYTGHSYFIDPVPAPVVYPNF